MLQPPSSPVPAADEPLGGARRLPRHSDEALTGTTRLWLRRLPGHRRPLRLCELYPRVANRVACCWSDPALRQQALDDLLQDRRGGREGFPSAVVRELQRLREFDADAGNTSPGPPWWRAIQLATVAPCGGDVVA